MEISSAELQLPISLSIFASCARLNKYLPI